jgi:preprotein translocase subunit SecA
VSDTALLRPGVAIGRYPQQEDIRDSWLDKAAAEINGFIRQYALSKRPHYWRFVKRVQEQAGTYKLDTLEDAELRRLTDDCRGRLYSEGFLEQLVALSFAIVREVATRRLGLRHHDVQLLGGYAMLKGMVAEMETGEGKTLTATLTAATAAMAGIPVHIVTVNDFLVARDAQWMRPVYAALGLTVGTILEGMSREERQKAYACDITYCTNKQLVFDYLKDRLLLGQEGRPLHRQMEELYSTRPRSHRLMMRGLCFAIVDEADSVLIDEARTPLVISRSGNMNQQEMLYEQALSVARKLESPRDFKIRSKERKIELTKPGMAHIARLTRNMSGLWSTRKRREELVKQGLSALHLFIRDKQYLVKDGKVQIIDEYTGRVMSDRSWERGLHQMIEAKENCRLSGRQETLARISYQRFFRRYLHLCGMTGTAREVARELWSVYRLNVTTVPTNKPVNRQHLPDRVFGTMDEKWQEIVSLVRQMHKQGRPVLIGTRSVAASEHLSKLLHAVNLPHQVLNARQDQDEAQVVAHAGQHGNITVATNMAGRGTDIRLAPGVEEHGGLFVLATERHDARRIDRQLFGRGGRQGDPGSYQAIVSLEDELLESFLGKVPQRFFRRLSAPEKPLPKWLGKLVSSAAQMRAERHNSGVRRRLLRVDDQLGDMMAFSGQGE